MVAWFEGDVLRGWDRFGLESCIGVLVREGQGCKAPEVAMKVTNFTIQLDPAGRRRVGQI
jgi:hypothetical protein